MVTKKIGKRKRELAEEKAETEYLEIGKKVVHKGRWAGEILEGGKKFRMQGSSTINRQRVEYTWTYTWDERGKHFLAVQSSSSHSGKTRFKGSYDSASGVLRMDSVNAEPPQRVEARFDGEVLKTSVSYLNKDGKPFMKGTSESKRVNAP